MSNKLKELGEILKTSPKGSAKYQRALKEIDKILGMPSELEQEHERLSEDD